MVSKLVHFYSYIIALFLSVHQSQCQILKFQLQTSSMSIDGSAWATYYHSTQNKIWLLSPVRKQSTGQRTYHSDIISYDIDNNIFETLPVIPNPIQSMNGYAPRYSVAIGEDIYFNGDLLSSSGGSVVKYNINTAISTQIKGIGFRQSCLATDGRFLFVIGGERVDSAAGVFDTRAYDTTTNIWYQGKHQLYASRRKPCEIINGILYTFGGDNGNAMDYIAKLHVGSGAEVIDNYQANAWEAAGNLITARRYHNTAVCPSLAPNLVYIIGGYQVDSTVLGVEIYDIITEITESAPFVLNEPRLNPAVMCIDADIYIFGGLTDAPWASGSSTDSWEKSILTEPPTTSPTSRTDEPSCAPTKPTNVPTKEPSAAPTSAPTPETDEPTTNPSFIPTNAPTKKPSAAPTLSPTEPPSKRPSDAAIIAVFPPPSSKSSIAPSDRLSSTKFITTHVMDNVIKAAPHKVDTVSIILIVVIVVTMIVIIVFLCYFIKSMRVSKMRKETMGNENEMVREQNGDRVMSGNLLDGTIANQFVDRCDPENDNDDDILEEVNRTAGGIEDPINAEQHATNAMVHNVSQIMKGSAKMTLDTIDANQVEGVYENDDEIMEAVEETAGREKDDDEIMEVVKETVGER